MLETFPLPSYILKALETTVQRLTPEFVAEKSSRNKSKKPEEKDHWFTILQKCTNIITVKKNMIQVAYMKK